MITKTHPLRLMWGDWLVIALSLLLIVFLFQTLWQHQPASKLKILQGNHTFGVFDLNQTRELHLHGAQGAVTISILQGKVRFKQSSCQNQYCVHQGWLMHAGQMAICIPNQISIQLLGQDTPYDSINY